MFPAHFAFAISFLLASASAQTAGDATKIGPKARMILPPVSAPQGSYMATLADDFNRPDAATLGTNWTVVSGAYSIITNRAVSMNTGSQFVQHATANIAPAQAVLELDFLPKVQGGALVFVAGVIGSGASTDNIFCKVQDNDSNGTYDRVYFYRGINGSAWPGSVSSPLVTPTISGRMKVYLTGGGDVAHIDIDNNFDGIYDEFFQAPGILAAGMNLGTAVGISTYNSPAVDNWMAGDGTPTTIVYCTAKVNSQGCSPSIAATGIPSATASSGFLLTASQELNNKIGLVIYSEFGRNASAFGSGGLLCVKAPIRRSKGLNSGGSLPPTQDCSGVFAVDFNTFARGLLGAPPNPATYLSLPGQVVTVQFWGSDPGIAAPNSFSLSNALEFVVGP